MREIKFRAWDGEKFVGFGPLYGLQAHVPSGWHADSGYTISQFSGVKDGKDKEIWEGDILEFRRKYTSTSELMSFREVVGFADGRFTNLPWGEEQVEVIGNIYENPELLKRD